MSIDGSTLCDRICHVTKISEFNSKLTSFGSLKNFECLDCFENFDRLHRLETLDRFTSRKNSDRFQ